MDRSFKNRLKRFLLSSNALFWVAYYKFVKRKNHNKLLEKEFEYVHVICPGPSAKNFFTSEHAAKEEHAIILVNHSLSLYPQLKEYTDHVFYFSSDGSRVKESITSKGELLDQVFSVLCPGHLFHLNKETVKKLDVVTLPKLTYAKDFGWVGVSKGPETFDALKKRPIASGFGSLAYALQLAVSFQPKTIRLWGCDFSEKKGERYAVKNVSKRDTPFDKIKRHFEIVEQIIKNKGIDLIR
jgi:hypothetical protein